MVNHIIMSYYKTILYKFLFVDEIENDINIIKIYNTKNHYETYSVIKPTMIFSSFAVLFFISINYD